VLQEAADELQHRHGAEARVAGAGRPVTKRDGRQTTSRVIVQRDNEAVGLLGPHWYVDMIHIDDFVVERPRPISQDFFKSTDFISNRDRL
jgi:hypothetical protein